MSKKGTRNVGSPGVAVILYTDWTDPSAEAHGKIF